MASKRRRLADANVARLAPALREYTIRDTRHARLGVRVRPSGRRSFVYLNKGSDGARRVTLGSAELMSVEEARQRCVEIDTHGQFGRKARRVSPTFGEFVSGPGQACFDRWKPSTRKTMGSLLNGRLMPAFGSMRLDRIDRAQVSCWFDEYSRTAPGGANHALALLRQFLNHAVACGHIETNPARGVRRNPRPKLTRFLSCEELRRLHGALDDHARTRASFSQQADVIRLLLLTGCRKSEIVTLRWRDLDGDTLHLSDGKTGARRVFLNAPARAILRRQPSAEGAFVFPSPFDEERALSSNLRLWNRVRELAGLEDVRLHDLRHTFASHAVMNGVPLPVVSRLLGHRDVRMTLRYAHLADKELEVAAERVGAAMAEAIAFEQHEAGPSPNCGGSGQCPVGHAPDARPGSNRSAQADRVRVE